MTYVKFTTEPEAQEFSRELWKSVRPTPNTGDVTTHLFGTIEGEAGDYALQIDPDFEFKFQNKSDVEALVQKLSPGTSKQEQAQISAKLRAGKIKTSDLMPNSHRPTTNFEPKKTPPFPQQKTNSLRFSSMLPKTKKSNFVWVVIVILVLLAILTFILWR